MTQPVESVYGIKPMEPKLTIEVKFDVAEVIRSITGLLITVVYIYQYF